MYILYFLFFALSFGSSAEIIAPSDECKVRPVSVIYADQDGSTIQICDHHLGDPVYYGVVSASDIHAPLTEGSVDATSAIMTISYDLKLSSGVYYFGASIDGKMDYFKFIVD